MPAGKAEASGDTAAADETAEQKRLNDKRETEKRIELRMETPPEMKKDRIKRMKEAGRKPANNITLAPRFGKSNRFL